VIRKQKWSKSKPQFNAGCKKALVRRNNARLTWLANTTNYNNERLYITQKKEVYIILGGKNKNL